MIEMHRHLLREYIQRILEEELSFRDDGRPKRLRIFDFDDTLVRTDAMVHVRKHDGQSIDMSPAEYAVYVPESGDEFDFSDFKKIINPKLIHLTHRIFSDVYRKWGSSGLVILTARGADARKSIEEFLDSIGAHGVEVVTVNSSDPMAKAVWIKDRITRDGITYVEFFDDSSKNVAAVSSLQDEFDPDDVRIVSRQVVHRSDHGVTTRSLPPVRDGRHGRRRR